MADFKTVQSGDVFGIIIAGGKEYLTIGNDYTSGINPMNHEWLLNGEPVEVAVVGFDVCDTTCEVTIDESFESTIECLGLSIIANGLVGPRPPRRPR